MSEPTEPTDEQVLEVIQLAYRDAFIGFQRGVYLDRTCLCERGSMAWQVAKMVAKDRLSRKPEPATRLPHSHMKWKTFGDFVEWLDGNTYTSTYEEYASLFEPAPEPVKVTWRDVFDGDKESGNIPGDVCSVAFRCGYKYFVNLGRVSRVVGEYNHVPSGITIEALNAGVAIEEASE